MSTDAAFRGYLDKVHAALSGGDPNEGERLAKAVTALVRAERDVAEYLRDVSAGAEYDDPDAIRAEVLRRLARLADAGAADQTSERDARLDGEGDPG